MSNTRAKLQTLIKAEDWHPSALAIFNGWNEQLTALEVDKNFLDLPKVKKLSGQLKEKIDQINGELLTDRELSKEGRLSLFNLRDITELVLSYFSIEENNKQISLIDHEIEEEAKARNIGL